MTLSDQKLQSVFMETTGEVLETMFFVGVLGECAAATTTDAEMLYAELVFHGTPSGRFGVGVPMATAELIAANFLGKGEEEITREDAREVLCELTNMICGSVLSRIESEARFELLHPAILSSAPAGPDLFLSSFELEEGAITVWMAEAQVTRDVLLLGRN